MSAHSAGANFEAAEFLSPGSPPGRPGWFWDWRPEDERFVEARLGLIALLNSTWSLNVRVVVTPGLMKEAGTVMQKVEPSGFWKFSIWVPVAGFPIPGFLVVFQIGSNGYLHSPLGDSTPRLQR